MILLAFNEPINISNIIISSGTPNNFIENGIFYRVVYNSDVLTLTNICYKIPIRRIIDVGKKKIMEIPESLHRNIEKFEQYIQDHIEKTDKEKRKFIRVTCNDGLYLPNGFEPNSTHCYLKCNGAWKSDTSVGIHWRFI